ncbi:MAG: hypothetical protein KAT85_07650 [candidate division Zixibacteria bacterium]|nr:hypothetical protein [candidate division Zixibacteria bacterium]
MNWKRLSLAAVLVFVALIVTELIIHLVILKGCYEPLQESGIFGSQERMSSYMWVKILIGAVFAYMFVFIFARGYEGRGLMEGVRYGIYITLFFNFVMAYLQFVLYEIPYSLVWSWIISGLVQNIIFGLIAAAVYKKETASI